MNIYTINLSGEFLKECPRNKYSTPASKNRYPKPASKLEITLQAFPLKHLNIIDPLRESNNLGRGVNRGLEN